MSHRLRMGGGALIALTLLFLGSVILVSKGLHGPRLDLTENRLYTIADGTRNIIQKLPEPVNLYFFFSAEAAQQVTGLDTYATRVRELLEELASRSGGKLRLSVIDPQPFSEEEDRAAALGLRAVPMGANGTQVYFGLAGTNSTDGHASIEFFDPGKEEFLEYDIAKLIYQLGNEKKPAVGWFSSLPMDAGMDPASGQFRDAWVVLSQARQLFDVRIIDRSGLATIDPAIKVLVLVHPKELTPATEFAIDQFVMRGGRVLAFIDPLAEQDESAAEPGNPMAALGADRASRLSPLLKAWGVDFDSTQIVGDLHYGMTVAMRQGMAPVRHIGILGLDRDAFDQKDVVSGGLGNINLASAGELKPIADSKLKFEPLLLSSTDSGLLPAARFSMMTDPATLRDGFRPDGQRHVLAARVSGPIRSAFADAAPEGTAASDERLRESREPANLVIVADTDLLSDFMWVRQQNLFGQRIVQPWANNGDFVWNVIENLAGSNDLISVRGRASFTRPFGRVDDLRVAAEDRFRAKEQELEQELAATEQKLSSLQTQRNDSNAMLLTPEQEAELERFQDEKLRIRKELRAVRAGLDSDIKALGNRLKFVNIVLVPVAFALLALIFVTWRRRSRGAPPAARTGDEP
ncbi:MAG: Gldg family protein [Steroidobacteraceae bacterium]